ncbi:MAG: UMP kinase [Nanoarchaeota archaeon]|nr:UMP kinase [Nanoarchaeota archaeon]
MTRVLSLGGSLIVPEKIDTAFLQSFTTLLKKYTKKEKIILVCGGGATCRQYQNAARTLGIANKIILDRIGIAATHLNAQLLHALFPEAYPSVVTNQKLPHDWDQQLLIAGGAIPGQSTDQIAVELAKQAGATTIYNLTNTIVYDADPKKNPTAKPLQIISWNKYLTIIGDYWEPGRSTPFDPVAANAAKDAGITVHIVDARDPVTIEACLTGTPSGTTIS